MFTAALITKIDQPFVVTAPGSNLAGKSDKILRFEQLGECRAEGKSDVGRDCAVVLLGSFDRLFIARHQICSFVAVKKQLTSRNRVAEAR